MAEPIGIASGLVALTAFAVNSSINLYNLIHSFGEYPSQVQQLLDELNDLRKVLTALEDWDEDATNEQASTLSLPLLRCGNACRHFEARLTELSAGKRGRSFRGWVKLKYMGEGIDGFKNLLVGYKLTLTLALTDVTLRKTTVTTETLKNYQSLVEEAQLDLQMRLDTIDGKLEALIAGLPEFFSESEASEIRAMREERLSARLGLRLCSELADHIDQLQISLGSSSRDASPKSRATSSTKITRAGLQECKDKVLKTSLQLEENMQQVLDRIVEKSKASSALASDVTDLQDLRDEWQLGLHRMHMHETAETHLKETISNIENYATGNAFQVMVSTDGRVLHGKNRALGELTNQIGGHIGENALLQISRDMTTSLRDRDSLQASTTPPPPRPADTQAMPSAGDTNNFERYGPGMPLKQDDAQNATCSPTPPLQRDHRK